MKRRHGINTSHQPDPNKIAVAAAAAAAEAAAAASNSTLPSVVSATMATHNIYVNQSSNTGHDEHLVNRGDRGVQFYNPAPVPPYAAAPLPAGTMLGFYNIPQLQQSMETSTIEMLHSVQQR